MPEPSNRPGFQQLKPRTSNTNIIEDSLATIPEATVSSTDQSPLVETVKDQVASILDPIQRHTALVKIQGPFNDVQLDSIARGMVYLQKLGLVSVIVVERDDWTRGDESERTDVTEDGARVVKALEQQGARARPVFQAIARLGPKPAPSNASTGNSPRISRIRKSTSIAPHLISD